MIEWQSESGNLILRIHGKQWYWVYKYDLSNVFSFLETPKSVGKNRWVLTHKGGSKVFDNYLQLTQLKIKNSTQSEYWEEALTKEFNPTSTFNVKLNSNPMKSVKPSDKILNFIEFIEIKNNSTTPTKTTKINDFLDNSMFFKTINLKSNNILKNLINSNNPNTLNFYENNALDDEWEVYSNLKINEATKAVYLTQTQLNDFNIKQLVVENTSEKNLIKLNFVNSNETVVEKPEENVDFLVVKQKRYKRKQSFKNYNTNILSGDGIETPVKSNEKTSRFLKNNLIFQQITNLNTTNAFDFYSSIKLNRIRSENFSINLSRRLLRTTRTLVLPAFTNISIIANSYDVVHSWFIPGLGLKIDCVPGKSTHHSLYIDNVGLYYGQCAEICGRYHHHMPIRVCALPFEHFIVWWTTKGLPKSTKMRYDPKKVDPTLLYKYNW